VKEGQTDRQTSTAQTSDCFRRLVWNRKSEQRLPHHLREGGTRRQHRRQQQLCSLPDQELAIARQVQDLLRKIPLSNLGSQVKTTCRADRQRDRNSRPPVRSRAC
jgi:hypothetical protein